MTTTDLTPIEDDLDPTWIDDDDDAEDPDAIEAGPVEDEPVDWGADDELADELAPERSDDE